MQVGRLKFSMADFGLPVGSVLTESVTTAVTASSTWPGQSSTGYVELFSSLAFDIGFIELRIDKKNTTYNTEDEIKLAVGGSGSEVDIVSGLKFSGKLTLGIQTIRFPINVAAGQRLSISIPTSSAYAYTVTVHATDFKSVHPYTQAVEITSSRVAVDSGGTANTKGSWTEITASMPHEFTSGIFLFSFANFASASNFLFDVAVGGSGSEEIIVSNIYAEQTAAEQIPEPYYAHFSIAKGERIAVRSQCDTTDATDRVLYINLLGFK